MKVAARLLALLLALVTASPLLAHDGLPITVSISETEANLYRTRLFLPPAVPEAQRPAVRLSPPCRAGSAGDFTCPDGLAGSSVMLDWPSGIPAVAVMVRVRWNDGQGATSLGEPGQSRIALPRREEAGQVFASYFRIGVEHILFGWDHLVFVACLLLIAGSGRRVAVMISGFTIGHAVTITAASLGLAGLPMPPVEAAIALSIMVLAAEILRDDRSTLLWRHPMLITSGFGLLHGFGFSGALMEIGLPPTELGLGLLAFNLGIELGQLAFVAGLGVVAWLLSRSPVAAPARLRRGFALAAGSLAAFWLYTRIPGLLG